MLCAFQKLLARCFGRFRNAVDVQDNLETLIWIITNRNANSRKSGKVIFGSLVVQNFWTCCFRSHRNAVHVPDILSAVFWTLPKCCGRSRISGNCGLEHNEGKCKFQKIWKVYFLVIQKFCGVPEFLDLLFSIPPKCCARSRNSWCGVFDPTECCGRSRYSGNCGLDHNEHKCKFQKIWKGYFWSYRNSVVVQNFWTCCFRSNRWRAFFV